jgi:tyrosyl-tRNA synthetase
VINERANPMVLKKDLARRIVTDFHSAQAAAKAGEDWANQVQKGEAPADLVAVDYVLPEGSGGAALRRFSKPGEESSPVRLDKLIRQVGLASSNTEAATKLKEGAVKIDGLAVGPQDLLVDLPLGRHIVVRVGRNMKKVRIVDRSAAKWQ